MHDDTRVSLRRILERHGLEGPPIILGGCGRSGTTLLLAMLGGHPRIHAIPEETQAFCPTAYATRDGAAIDLRDGNGTDRGRLHQYRMSHFVPHARFGWERLDEAIACHPPSRRGLRWCEKTPKNVLFFRRLLDELDEARLIHVVRDGRDVVTSVHPDRDGRFHVPPERWIEEVEAGLRLAGDDRVLTVRHEDLVLDYHRTIATVCDFIREPFDEQLLDWHHHTNVQQHDSWDGLRVTELYVSAIGRWRQERYSEVVGDLMGRNRAVELLQRLGYLP